MFDCIHLALPQGRNFSGKAAYAFTPALQRIAIMGHQFVKADWNKFSPTNAVNKYQYGLTQYPKAREAITKAPAISLR
jgi:hypothetical protein